jgi:hypothetical protein
VTPASGHASMSAFQQGLSYDGLSDASRRDAFWHVLASCPLRVTLDEDYVGYSQNAWMGVQFPLRTITLEALAYVNKLLLRVLCPEMRFTVGQSSPPGLWPQHAVASSARRVPWGQHTWCRRLGDPQLRQDEPLIHACIALPRHTWYSTLCRKGVRDCLLRAVRRHALLLFLAACMGFPYQSRRVFQHPGLAHTWYRADSYLASHDAVVSYCTSLPAQGNDGILMVQQLWTRHSRLRLHGQRSRGLWVM